MFRRVLTINTGSSSLKAALYHMGGGDPRSAAGAQPVPHQHGSGPSPAERLEFAAEAQRIGEAGSRLRVSDADGTALHEQQSELSGHEAALDALLAWMRGRYGDGAFDAVGHRLVHGGARFSEPAVITADVLAGLCELLPIDPDHLPQALAVVERLCRSHPGIPQVACFDTAFHRRMPRVARIFALPRWTEEAGIVRYGFHGLSYEYVLGALRDQGAAGGRLIIAHLGSGASMAAVRDGAPIDTTMGFTPTGGLVMGTRSGDLDPGVLLYLLEQRGMTPAKLKELLNMQSGLLGVSGTSSDMRDLLAREREDPRAAEAIDLFCYQARKFVGALAAALGGLDTLVFTGGIGERAPAVRARICAGLDLLGVHLDPTRNEAGAAVICRAGSPVTVRVIPTNEDLMIARHTTRTLTAAQGI